MKVKRCSSTEREVYRLELWIKGKEIYKGESKADNDQTKPDLVSHLRTFPIQQLELSSFNKMTDRLISGPIEPVCKLYTKGG